MKLPREEVGYVVSKMLLLSNEMCCCYGKIASCYRLLERKETVEDCHCVKERLLVQRKENLQKLLLWYANWFHGYCGFVGHGILRRGSMSVSSRKEDTEFGAHNGRILLGQQADMKRNGPPSAHFEWQEKW